MTVTAAAGATGDLVVDDPIHAWLAPARVANQLSYADIQLAMTIVRRSGDTKPDAATMAVVALSTALLSRAGREGHSAIRVEQLVQQGLALVSLLTDSLLSNHIPTTTNAWAAALQRSSAVGDGTTHTPLVLQEPLVQFTRYYDAEQRIASEVQRRLAHTTTAGLPAFAMVTGGPGTGKTTHIARLIVDLHTTHPAVQVALAAPTGKAAARLTESVRQRLNAVAVERGVEPQPISEARTLHRLLQFNAYTNTFRRTRFSPLNEDLVIVDEASMVDILMLDAVLRAVKPDAAIILVGDHQQLASVDSGDAFGALYRAAMSMPDQSPLRESVTVLTQSYRFANQPAIGHLANAILDNDINTVSRVATNAPTGDVQVIPFTNNTDTLLASVIPLLTQCLHAQTPLEFLDTFESFRLLTPERAGIAGVDGLNRAVEQWLTAQGGSPHGEWYHGRPVMVTANDYGINIFNGDVGVVWREGGSTAVYFRTAGGALHALVPTRLPTVETAWAMTVHKSQGSEFDSIVVVVPESRIMSRQLLYTAVTRAKRRITIATSPGSLQVAMAKGAHRISGLERAVTGTRTPSSSGRNQ